MGNPALRLVVPATENRTVRPRRLKNEVLRTREHLLPAEVDALAKAARSNRHGLRDSIMILMAYQHGLRARELVDMEWTQVDFDGANLAVRRRKNGSPSTHPITGDTLRALRKLRREAPHARFVFMTERESPFSTAGFAKMIDRAARKAGLTELKPHPHMLRHARGYKLANEGKDTRSIQGFLGHKSIQNTVKYTELAPNRFSGFSD
jgi:type 1 fimbriae regulatory protein FimB/type 1 fimbriae regulatory protein FimE